MGAPLPIQLSSLGMADSLILMVLALVVFGPRRLPQIGRQIGKLMYEFRKASNDFKFQMEEELRLSEDADRKKREEATRAALPAPAQTVIEAGANTALAEQVSVSAQPSVSDQPPVTGQPPAPAQPPVSDQPSPYPGETTYPSQYPPETPPTPAAETESHLTLPRTVPVLQPPSTGEQVQAARPGAALVESAPRVDETLEANLAAEPTNSHSPSAQPEDPTRSETVSQHG
jgi:sec-independent protein translocase protein TatB